MHKENVKALIEYLEAIQRTAEPEVGFNMGSYYEEGHFDPRTMKCGTTACLAGHTCILFIGLPTVKELGYSQDCNLFTEAMNVLELDDDQARELFLGYGYGKNVNLEQSIVCLHKLYETERVDWSHI